VIPLDVGLVVLFLMLMDNHRFDYQPLEFDVHQVFVNDVVDRLD
jgi:hypothetical protein